MEEQTKRFASVIVENRLSNRLFDTILQHRSMLPEWWAHAHVNDPSVKTLNDYNRLLTSRQFWEKFERFDRVLIFQHDTRILRKGIEEFLGWDYVGAPWSFQEHGGNGGLSLRNPKTMLEIIKNERYTGDPYEDVWFCNMMLKNNMNLAPREVCSKFSVESVFALGSWGCHAIEAHLTVDEIHQVLTQYKTVKV